MPFSKFPTRVLSGSTTSHCPPILSQIPGLVPFHLCNTSVKLVTYHSQLIAKKAKAKQPKKLPTLTCKWVDVVLKLSPVVSKARPFPLCHSLGGRTVFKCAIQITRPLSDGWLWNGETLLGKSVDATRTWENIMSSLFFNGNIHHSLLNTANLQAARWIIGLFLLLSSLKKKSPHPPQCMITIS